MMSKYNNPLVSILLLTRSLAIGNDWRKQLRNAHDQSQITNVAWLDNSSLVSTGQVMSKYCGSSSWFDISITSGFLEFVIDESSFIISFQDANIKIWNISWPNWRHLKKFDKPDCFLSAIGLPWPLLQMWQIRIEICKLGRNLLGFLPEQDTDLYGWFAYFGTNFLLTPYVLLTLALTRWNYYVAVVWAHAWWSCVVYDWLHVDDCGFLCVMTSLVSDVTLWWDDCLVRRLFISDIYRFINKLWFCSDAWVSSDKDTPMKSDKAHKIDQMNWSLFVKLGMHPIS